MLRVHFCGQTECREQLKICGRSGMHRKPSRRLQWRLGFLWVAALGSYGLPPWVPMGSCPGFLWVVWVAALGSYGIPVWVRMGWRPGFLWVGGLGSYGLPAWVLMGCRPGLLWVL